MEKKLKTRANMILIKIVVAALLLLIMLIPITMIKSLIQERQGNKNAEQTEMGWKWGGSQQITGPVMAIPYIKVGNNSQDVIYFLPDEYNVTGDIKPEERVRGIQKILNYQAEMKINGSFSFPDVESLGIKSSQVLWDKCFIMLGISNMQGIKNKIAINLDGKSYEVSPNIPQNSLIDKGLSVKIGLDPENPVVGKYDFDLTLNGTEGLYFLPVGKHTGIHLTSAWKSVGYIGDFVATENTDLSNGIDSKWDIFDYNRNFVQLWTGSNPNLEQSEIGADLLLPINHYEKTLRAVKYALMFIMLTFLVFFLIEFVGKKQIHPVQYLLVSLALVLFYTLLLAFSEHIGFDWSYLISSLATIVLITAYSSSIFRDKRQTTLMGVFLTVLYIYLYVVLQQENMALLFGAIGLFIGLACVMFVLRKVNWYRETITD